MIENRPIWPVFLYPPPDTCTEGASHAPNRPPVVPTMTSTQPPGVSSYNATPGPWDPAFSKGGVGCASSVTTTWLTLRTMAAFKRIHWQWPQVHWKLRQKKQKNETTQVQLVICEIGMQLDVFLKTNRFPCHNGSLWRHMAKYTSYPFSILHQTRVFIVLCTLTYITDWLLMYSTYHYLKAHLRKRQSIELKW